MYFILVVMYDITLHAFINCSYFRLFRICSKFVSAKLHESLIFVEYTVGILDW
jgi:hypothetical protein